jgi:hypothetical protein
VKYRILDHSEWDRLGSVMDKKFIPHPDTASAAVAEDDSGAITGVLFLQLTLHMEPLVLKSPKASFARLYETLYEAVKADKGLHFFVFSDKEIVDRMATHVGMKETPYKVFEGQVT